YAEAWGNRYDFDQYDSVLPKFIEGPINSPADLGKIEQISPTGGVFGEQLELVRQIKAGIGGAHFLQTIFSPISVLALLIARPEHHTVGEAVQAQYDAIRHFIEEDPQAVHAAL